MMKKINNFSLYALVPLLVFCTMLMSCEDDEPKNSGIVELQSFGPSGVKHGEIIKFIGKNLDKVTSIVLPQGVEVTDFVTKTSTLIEITVPKAAEAGKVVLKTPQGDIESKSMLSFEVPVVITDITDEARPGDNITITGDLLNWIETITFEDGLVVEEFESQSMEELVVKVPMDAQTGFLIFSSGGTEPLTFASEEQLIVTLPTVVSLSPVSVKHTEDLTITGTDLDLVTSVIFTGDFEVQAVDFVSQSATEIKVTVPAMTLKGPITLKQLSPVDVITSQEVIITLPVGISLTPSPAIPGTDNITITGTDLDLVEILSLPGVGAIESSEFISHSATEIVLALPAEATAGGVNYTTIHGYESNLGVNVILPGEGPKPLPVTMYDETTAPGGGDWSWNTAVSNPASTEQFYSGDVSWKYTTTSDGGMSVGGLSPVDASGQNVFAFSLFGGPGTDGASVAAILNDNWGNYNAVQLVEGEWTEYEIDLSLYPGVNLSAITRFTFKVEGMTGTTIYVDRVGFGPGGPDHYIYDEALGADWQQWGGWGLDVQDAANTEQPARGSNAIKLVYNDNYGGFQLHPVNDEITIFSDYETFVLSVYGGAGSDGQTMAIQIKDTGGNLSSDVTFTVDEGEYKTVEIPISSFGTAANSIGELIIKNYGVSPKTVYIDEIGLK